MPQRRWCSLTTNSGVKQHILTTSQFPWVRSLAWPGWVLCSGSHLLPSRRLPGCILTWSSTGGTSPSTLIQVVGRMNFWPRTEGLAVCWLLAEGCLRPLSCRHPQHGQLLHPASEENFSNLCWPAKAVSTCAVRVWSLIPGAILRHLCHVLLVRGKSEVPAHSMGGDRTDVNVGHPRVSPHLLSCF